jgi:hypothetical protein
MQKWYNFARDDVLRLRSTPPFVNSLVGWLVANHCIFTLKMSTEMFAEALDNFQRG